MDLQSVIISRPAARLGLILSRLLPPETGHRLADSLAARIAKRREMPMIQAIRSNQWVISGGTLSEHQLDIAVREVMQQTGRAFFNLFHYHDHPESLQEFVASNERIEDLIKESHSRERGAIVLGLHMSNFDLVAQAIVSRGMRVIGLSLPQTTEAIEWQHALRRDAGMEILPASIANIRQVIRRLRQGEIMVTGVDRPIDQAKYKPRFFGHPAKLPVHYVPIALKAQVPVIVMATIMQEDGRCHIYSSDYIHLEPHNHKETELLQNAERVLEVAEGFISKAPQQWIVIQPVWPQFIGEAP